MKVWYDACTGKHIRYGVAIAKTLRKSGHEVILTTRKHPDTIALAKILNENPIVIGKYDPTSLYTRLEESSKRILRILKLLKKEPPDLAISHQSVELCRIAFGLKIPIILTADTPHADAVNRLTLPLADVVVVSKAIPKHVFSRYGARRIIQFDGVDEVAWIQNADFHKKYNFPKPLIVIRQMETKAAYALGKSDITEKLAKKLTKLGNVFFIARYSKKRIKGVISPEKFVDTAALVSQADLVVSVGGTIAREAALQGVPSIVLTEFGQTHVNKYLAQKGFPLFMVHSSKVMTAAKKYLGQKWDVKDKFTKMENPIQVIQKIVEEKIWQKNKKDTANDITRGPVV